MAEGYVTQTRTDQGNPLTGRGFAQGPWTFPGVLTHQQTQTTRSYRTDARGLVNLESPDDEVKTQADVFRSLKRDRNSGSKYDTGHDFSTSISRQAIFPTRKVALGYYSSQWCETDLFPDPYGVVEWGQPELPAYDSNQSTLDGTHAINATLPNKSIASLNVGLAELVREGFPKAIGTSFLSFKKLLQNPLDAVGGEHLNVQFGWKPLAADVRSAAHAIVKSHDLLRQYERDSGKNVRRRFEFPVQRSTSVRERYCSLYLNGMDSSSRSCFASTDAPATCTDTSFMRRWFSGAYTYHFAISQKDSARMDDLYKKANHLLGLDLTAEVLWNLAPWSWLSDWVANTGDNISNASAFQQDGLVLRYGYLMVHRETYQTRRMDAVYDVRGNALLPGSIVLTTTSKTREPATPYGFGIDTSSFTGHQWGILGALGMTKAPNLLH